METTTSSANESTTTEIDSSTTEVPTTTAISDTTTIDAEETTTDLNDDERGNAIPPKRFLRLFSQNYNGFGCF